MLEDVHVPVAWAGLPTGYWGQVAQSVQHPPAAELPVAGWCTGPLIENQHPSHEGMRKTVSVKHI